MIGIRFPVKAEGREDIPWGLVEAHRQAIEKKYGRPLEYLAAHGGLELRELAELCGFEDDLESHLQAIKQGHWEYMKHIGKLLLLAALLLLPVATKAQVPYGYLSAATTNSTEVLAGRSVLWALLLVNTTTTLYYLKIYDTATAPTCGTGTPKWRIPIPYGSSNAGGGVALPPAGLLFNNGIGFCLTGGIADNDTTSAATGVAINLGASGR